MERYELMTVDSPEEIERAPIARVAHFCGGTPGYEPRTEAAIVLLHSRGFLVRMQSFETVLRAECRVPDGEVCRDSCMEFFVNFAPEKGGDYLNLEVNPLGTLHCRLGPGRGGRRALPPELGRPEVRCAVLPDRWTAELFLPLPFVGQLFGRGDFAPGELLRGNFYKCGDDTVCPHYGMWSPVISPTPDFHRPEYFGELVLV